MHTVSGHDGCTEGSVRLVNSIIEYEGRVEVCVDGVWGTVCGVGALDATTICHVAGYAGGIILNPGNCTFNYYAYIMQYQSTIPHPQCLEMVTVQLSIDLAVMDVKQASAIAVNTRT